jgi:hypothetical protein
MVRESIARHSARPSTSSGQAETTTLHRSHASHAMLPLARGSDGDGACLIEPTVRCNHCGYCLSYGH